MSETQLSNYKKALPNMKIYPSSKLEKDGTSYLLGKEGPKRVLIAAGSAIPADFKGEPGPEIQVDNETVPTRLWEDSGAATAFLRDQFTHLAPQVFGTAPGFGCGDRLGTATPGHIMAIAGSGLKPMFAQQSMRENSRTGRNMQSVIDDATWGAFEAGYTEGFGADADHIKEPEDIQKAIDVGYTFFTVDPSDHVRDEVLDMDDDKLTVEYKNLSGIEQLEKRCLGKRVQIDGLEGPIVMEGAEYYRAVLTYSGAIDHLEKCYKLLREKRGEGKFDFEASVDETATPTTPLAHVLIVEELRARGVNFHSLALRFVGEFQKGIDYIGDIAYFEDQFKRHAAIARHFGGYKLGIHSGSDKFSIYPIINRHSSGALHVKTAGTSWLEAVHTVAKTAPALYRKIHTIALENFEKDRASYHVTTDLEKIPALDKVADDQLDQYLKENDPRQLLHITYGSILNAENGAVGAELYDLLAVEEETHYNLLAHHIGNHIKGLK
jgi:tagaturonate epimerase